MDSCKSIRMKLNSARRRNKNGLVPVCPLVRVIEKERGAVLARATAGGITNQSSGALCA